MSTVELRHLITEYLTQIDDISFLKAIKTIIESKVSDGVYKLSEYQKNGLNWRGNRSETGKPFRIKRSRKMLTYG